MITVSYTQQSETSAQFETGAGCLRSTDPTLGMGHLFCDVTKD